ncbi:MAG: AEC family transporter [Lachnospiraceae bacterium]
MNIFVVIQQMLVLLVMIMVGFFAYRGNWIDDHSYGKLSKIVINILNPCILINGVLGKNNTLNGQMVMHNLILVVAYFTILVLISLPIVKILRFQKKHENVYRLMFIFSNVGFMGIPVISSIYGQEAIILIAFYTLGYNALLYSYGILLASSAGGDAGTCAYVSSDQKEDDHHPAEKKTGFWRQLINPGIVACVVAIAIFAAGIQMPDSVCTFFDYMGNSVVPFSMMLIGASLAQGGKKEFFTDIKFYLFAAIKLLVVPIAMALLLRVIPGVNQWEAITKGVFLLMLAMPVGSIVVMMAKEYGADEMESTKGSIISTLLAVITIPIVAAFLPF